jgi:uncharacterized membrane protein YdcZ (DUF606 family)
MDISKTHSGNRDVAIAVSGYVGTFVLLYVIGALREGLDQFNALPKYEVWLIGGGFVTFVALVFGLLWYVCNQKDAKEPEQPHSRSNDEHEEGP